MEKCAICKRYHFPGNNCEEATEAETTPSTERDALRSLANEVKVWLTQEKAALIELVSLPNFEIMQSKLAEAEKVLREGKE